MRSCSHIECDGISHLLWLGSEDPQTCQDMVGSINDEVANFYIKIYLEVKLQTKLRKRFKNPQIVPCKPVLPCLHEDNSLSSCQPPVDNCCIATDVKVLV